jgi:hypothetical protein
MILKPRRFYRFWVCKKLYSDTTVPRFNIDIASNNASFQYPDLPKSVRNIVIDTKIINDRILNDTCKH